MNQSVIIQVHVDLRKLLTQLEFVPWELPLLIVRQLSGVNEGVVVSISRLDDLPTDLVPGLLHRKKEANDT